MLERIGRTLRAFHGAGEIRGRFSIFEHQRRYTEMSRAEGLNLPPDIDELNRVAADIEASLARAQTPDRLCHNDLQLPNFIITGPEMVVLDWEWAGMGDPYFDLGATAVNAELGRDEVARLAAAYFENDDPVHEARVELMMFMSALREATWALVAEPVPRARLGLPGMGEGVLRALPAEHRRGADRRRAGGLRMSAETTNAGG